MKYAILPILIIVSSNVLYNICTKETPQGVNLFASLAVTYVAAALFCLLVFAVTERSMDFVQEVRKLNWTAVALAVAIIGLEFGYLVMYRAGWPVSLGSIVSNVLLAIALLLIGLLFYKERVTWTQAAGLLLCLVGLVLVLKD